MTIACETAEPLSIPMIEALEAFNAAGGRIEAFYRRLAGEVQRLTGELERSNLGLRLNLAEKEKMQAILVSTLQSLTVGVLAVGQDGIVIVANPAACRMLDRPLERLAARRIEAALEGVPCADALILALQGEGSNPRRLRWSCPANAECGMRNAEFPERTGPSAIPGSRQLELAAVRATAPYDLHLAGVVLIEDRTELRRLEAEAQLRSRLTGMGEIAMNLAHEIRNPLGSIALFASALARELAADSSLGPLAEQIVNGVKSLEHLVANTLEFARPRRMAMTRVNLAEVLHDALVYVEHPLGQKSIQVRFEADPREAWIAGDAEQLRQVFLNLFINAIQAMEEGGSLTLALRPVSGGGWEVAVADDGIGIAPELLEKIFDPFFTTKDKGSGIGLAIVHTILTAHRARIAVDSHPGQGTTFRLTFPKSIEVTG